MHKHIQLNPLRSFLNKIFFELSTPQGRFFNHFVIVVIVLAVFLTMLDTIPHYHQQWGNMIDIVQKWVLVGFAVEYILRLYAAPLRLSYAKSFAGLIDLITVLPLFFGLDGHVLVRLLRLVRVIKVAFYFPVVRTLFSSLQGALPMLLGVLGTIGLISVLMGNLIFILEPGTFADAFEGTWWSLVTMSTVGYGDFVPQTPVGRIIAAVLIMAGICMFAMVTAVISVRIGRMVNMGSKCISCNKGISIDYPFCQYCGHKQSDDMILFDND